VPRDAINEGPDGPYVYVVEDGKAVQHNVRIRFDDANSVAVNGEVKPGDQVIVEGNCGFKLTARSTCYRRRPARAGGSNTSPDAAQDQGRGGDSR